MSELCLVTGGAGFIGSHLVEGLLASGRRVRVLDDFSTGQQANLATHQVETAQGDVGSPADVQRAMADVQMVFHLAALASVPLSLDKPAASHHVNLTGTVHVLDAARRAGATRVVIASSSAVYGNSAGDLQRESDVPETLSPYAASKLAGEYYAQAFTRSFGLQTACVRFFNIFGPRQRDDSPYSGVIALFAAALAAGRTPTIFGDGLQSRDFTFVTDAVQGLIKASEAAGAAGAYNIGTGQRTTILDLFTTMKRLLGSTIEVQHGPPRAGEVKHSCADISRARRELGFQPAVSFEEGLRRTLDWYRTR
ncbi:MAG: NAD-dependent epimerase/dehydratase family protein [Gemmataceae bacterium]